MNGPRGSIGVFPVYRTFTNAAGPFGVGTGHNYNYLLNTNVPWTATVINLAMPNRNQFSFVRQADGTLVNTTNPTLRGVVLTTPVNAQAILRWKDGTIFRFQPRGFDLGIAASTLESITDTNGNTTTLVRDPSRAVRITEVIDPVGRKLLLSYDPSNRITLITDPIGRQGTYTYNVQGTLETVTDPEGGVTRYDYDTQNRLIKVTDARGVVVARNAYDANGRVIEQEQADGGKLKFAYTLLNPAVPTSPVLKTVFTDALGRPTTYRFDPQGFLLDVTDPFEQTRIFEREPGTNLLRSIKGMGSCDACGNLSAGDESFTYDGNGNVVTRTDALNHTTQFTYDPVFNKVTSITEPTNPPATTSFTYDPKGNLAARKDANNHTTFFTYDPFGLLTKITDPLNKETTFGYDAFGNLTSITDPLTHPTTFRYDAISRQVETTDTLGRKSRTDYNNLNRAIEQTNAKGDKTKFAYDKVGNLLAVTDARNNTTEFTYDGMNRLVTKKTPLGKTDTREYDKNGNLTIFTDRRGQTSRFGYDVLDRLTGEGYIGGVDVARFYDAQGRLLRVEDSESGNFTFTYDLVGRTRSATSPFGAMQYEYDEVGRVKSRQVTGQSAVDYDYDPAGNLKRTAMSQAGVDFDYDARDQLHIMNRSNGVSSTYDYDDVGRVLSLTHAKGATVLNSQTYEYDEIGNRTNYETNIAQPLITQPVMNGNYDNDNKLLSNSDKAFTYDDNGNLKIETGPEGTTTYTWDARNRLASISTPDGKTINFLYDFAGNLIRKSVSGANPSSQEFVLDEITNIAYQKNSDGSQMSILTGQSIDTHLAVVGADGQVDFGLTDTVNSTTATTDQNGALGSQFFYEPFGQTTTNGDYPFQFTGRVPVTGNLYHYRARYYAPGVGRFVSEDPIGFAGGFNFYTYVDNNPIDSVDPQGLLSCGWRKVCKTIGKAIVCGWIWYCTGSPPEFPPPIPEPPGIECPQPSTGPVSGVGIPPGPRCVFGAARFPFNCGMRPGTGP